MIYLRVLLKQVWIPNLLYTWLKLSFTFSFNGAPADIHRLRVDYPDHRVALHLPCGFPGHEGYTAAIVRGNGCWVGVITPLCQAGESSQGHSFGTEDLSVRPTTQEPLCELHTASDVQQSLLKLHPL